MYRLDTLLGMKQSSLKKKMSSFKGLRLDLRRGFDTLQFALCSFGLEWFFGTSKVSFHFCPCLLYFQSIEGC